MRRNCDTEKGFTLVELLVVIAIIGTLATLLLPALNSSKARARTVACLSQLKQIGVASIAFAGDNSERLPAASMPNTNRFLSPFRALSDEVRTSKLFLCHFHPISLKPVVSLAQQLDVFDIRRDFVGPTRPR